MSLSDLGSIGEFISSIAVVLSLVYVAIQIRQNSRETRLASQQRALEASRDMIAQMASKEATEIFVKAMNDRSSLTQAEELQYGLLRMAQLRNIENAYLMHLEGVIDDDVFKIYSPQARNILEVAPDLVERFPKTTAFENWMSSEKEAMAAGTNDE